MLKWSPETFWRATFYELSCAFIGHMESVGALKDMVTDADKAEFDKIIALQEKLEADDPGGHKRRAKMAERLKGGK